jgi:hypothetical protein
MRDERYGVKQVSHAYLLFLSVAAENPFLAFFLLSSVATVDNKQKRKKGAEIFSTPPHPQAVNHVTSTRFTWI